MKLKPCCADAIEAAALAAEMVANKYDAIAWRPGQFAADVVSSAHRAEVAREVALEIRRLLKLEMIDLQAQAKYLKAKD